VSIIKVIVRTALVLSMGSCCVLPLVRVFAADIDPSIPPVVQKGLTLFESGGPQPAFDTWRQGGLLEGDKKAGEQTDSFKQTAKPLGNYKSYELIETKRIGQTSRTIYLSMIFERGIVYARFLVCRADKDWVVQNMDFNTKPEAIMPWLTFERNK